MLRKIITAYKAAFLFLCVLVLASSLILGFSVMIVGQTPSERWGGVAAMLGGSFFALMLAGNLALILENNELLRRISENLDRLPNRSRDKLYGDLGKTYRKLERKEPTL